HLFSRTFHGKKLNDSAGVAAFLLDQAHVAVVPGSAFYAPEYLRISYSTSMENIARGMDQIEKALKALQL
ncbi:MAG TPA: aspartate aminotransferase, partial [Ruminococcaceae bacterium]|nr:aspartate aminotransferase [Oscillospiraceae bacterium]